jgi:SAM domain (Sterile alpha motif)
MPAFRRVLRKNAINGEVLADPAAVDLRKLGVPLVGDRRKMLTTIGKLFGSSTISLGG